MLVHQNKTVLNSNLHAGQAAADVSALPGQHECAPEQAAQVRLQAQADDFADLCGHARQPVLPRYLPRLQQGVMT